MRHAMKSIVTGLLLLTSSWAYAIPSAGELVKDTSERMLQVIRTQQDVIAQDPATLYPLVKEIVVPHFDFDRISSWVLGKHWRKASADQKERFSHEFENLLIRTYATAMGEYSGQEINYLPVRAAPDATDVTVKTEVVQEGRPPVAVDYNLYLKDGDWKVYDVSILNTSLVANYRSSFASQIRSNGLDDVISKLAARNRQAGIASSGE